MHKDKKRCGKCRQIKSLVEFWRMRSAADGRQTRCIECSKRIKISDAGRTNDRLWRERIRQEVLKHYGGKCACCKIRLHEFLTLRSLTGKKVRTGNLFWWLKKNGLPEGFQVQCWNCLGAIERLGYCPHQPAI